MNICVITTEYVTEGPAGGIANQFHRISRWMVSHGHSVHVVTYSLAIGTILCDGVTVHRCAPQRTKLFHILNTLTLRRLTGTITYLMYMHSAYVKVRQLSRNTHFDIINSVVFRGCGLLTYILLRIPHVMMITSYRPVWDPIQKMLSNVDGKILELLEKLVLHVCNNFYIPSRALKILIEKREGITIDEVIPTPFYIETTNSDTAVYERFLKDKRYILNVGRFQTHKGVHILADALPSVLAQHTELYAVFIGKDALTQIGSMKAYILKACASFKDRIIFLDPMPHNQLYPIMQKALFLALPSLMDNLPNVILEAVGLGKVVIGTAGTSLDEVIIDGKSGFIVPPGNALALCDKINEVLNISYADRIERNAREEIKLFCPETLINKLLLYFSEIAEGTYKTRHK